MYGSRKYASATSLNKKYSDEQIFEFYLGGSIKYNVQMLSPFRPEKKPSCHFFKNRDGKPLFVDFGENKSFGAVDYVMRMFHLDYSEAINRIWSDLNGAKIPDRVDYGEELSEPRSYSSTKKISVESCDMSEADLKYWAEQGISEDTLKYFRICRVNIAWLDERIIYRHAVNDPCYAYLLGSLKYKLYYPYRGLEPNDVRPRFITNAPEVIQGYSLLPPTGQLLVITKSMKDVCLLKEYGIAAVAPQAEGYEIPASIIMELKLRFYKVVSLYDFDRAGVNGAQVLRKLFGITPLFLTNGRFNSQNYGAKDLTDFRKNFGKKPTNALINWALSLILEDNG